MTTETRYISFDGAIFYSEKECRDYEDIHMFAGLDKVIFLDINYEPINKGEYTLRDFLRNVWAIKVSTVKEAEKVWTFLKLYDENDTTVWYKENPFLNKDGLLEEKILVYSDNRWCTIPDYLELTFSFLKKIDYRPIDLARHYLHYLHKDDDWGDK